MDARLWDGTTDCFAMLRALTSPTVHLGRSRRKLRLFAVACHRSLPGFESWADGLDPKQIVLDAELHAEGPSHNENAPDDLNSRAVATSTWCGCWLAGDSAWWTVNSLSVRGRLKGPLSPVCTASLLREIFGNPFQSAAPLWADVTEPIDHFRTGAAAKNPFARAAMKAGARFRTVRKPSVPWLTTTVLSLAQAVYEERLPNGAFVSTRLFVLADALEEAGCLEAGLLSHLRSTILCANCGRGVSHLVDTEGRLYGGCLWCRATATMPHWHFPGCWALDLLLGKS